MMEQEPIKNRPGQPSTDVQPEEAEQGGRISRAIAAGDDFVLLDSAPGQMTVLWLDPTWGARAVAEHDAEEYAAAELRRQEPVVEETPIFLLYEEEKDKQEEEREAQRWWWIPRPSIDL